MKKAFADLKGIRKQLIDEYNLRYPKEKQVKQQPSKSMSLER